MNHFLSDVYYKVVISTLMAMDSSLLFDRLFGFPWYQKTHERWLDNCVGEKNHCRLLELGCGPGQLLPMAAHRGHRIVGLGRSQAMLKRAGNNLASYPDAELIRGSATTIPYADNSFDLVMASSLINIVDDPRAVLSEMYRVAAHGGMGSFLVPADKMDSLSAKSYIAKHNFRGMSAAALSLWASVGKKCRQKHLKNWQ